VLDEFYRVAFRKKIYRAIEELQADLDAWMTEYNERRSHQGRWRLSGIPCKGGFHQPKVKRSSNRMAN
jgi:hypothetical protein